MKCYYCGKSKAKKILVNIPTSESGWECDTKFSPDGEQCDPVWICDDCFDNEMITCFTCGYIARDYDAALYSVSDIRDEWKCDQCV